MPWRRKNSNDKKRAQKAMLFKTQEGKCHWCGVEMVLPEGHVRHQPRNLATLDHLDDKFSQERGKHYGEYRHVLACTACNGRRGRERELEMGIEFLRMQAGRFPAAIRKGEA